MSPVRFRLAGTVTLLVAMTLVGCSTEQEDGSTPTTSIPSAAQTQASSTTAVQSTTIAAPATTTTALATTSTEMTTTTSTLVTLAPASIFPPVRGVFAPMSGWIVSESPYVVGMAFWGTSSPDLVTINGDALVADDPAGLVFFSPPLDLAPGVNQVRLAVEHGGRLVEEAVIPVTYLEGAESALGWIAAATEDSVTVDFTEWDDDQEFPGPEDPDPGVLTAIPIGDQVRVIVSDETEVDYEWFRAEVNNGYVNLEGLPGLDEWNPGGVYPYVLTIHNGKVVQIWKIPLG